MYLLRSLSIQNEVAVMLSSHPQAIAVMNLGGQTTHLIASILRRTGAYSEVVSADTKAPALAGYAGMILSGGPASVYRLGAPQVDPEIFNLHIPILGICYGAQLIAHVLGGQVKYAKTHEYGHANLHTTNESQAHVLHGNGSTRSVWMSHGDQINTLPDGFKVIGWTNDCPIAAFSSEDCQIIGLQFHPEVTHTAHGDQILRRFAQICKAPPWSISSQIETIKQAIRDKVGDKNVFMLVSGGVDSTVAFTLLNKALGSDRVHGYIIDTGLMRHNEVADTKTTLQALGIDNIESINAGHQFLSKLKGVVDPEEKREVIGQTFVDVQQAIANQHHRSHWLLGQGTIYPDHVESGGETSADTIKTHHNRCPAIQQMIAAGTVIEPIADLYKDEARELGYLLGLPQSLVGRHPFPGPGLAIRVLCTDNSDLLPSEPQDMTTTLPIQSVGVQGDGRSFKWPRVLFGSSLPLGVIPPEFLDMARSIPNQESDINRTLVSLTSPLPPSLVLSPRSITPERIELVRQAHTIVETGIIKAGLYDQIWQFPVVLLAIGRTKEGQSLVLRPIRSVNAMTANAYILPSLVLRLLVSRLWELPGIDDIYLDLTSKPPGTIEWE